jgi:adenylate cyclase
MRAEMIFRVVVLCGLPVSLGTLVMRQADLRLRFRSILWTILLRAASYCLWFTAVMTLFLLVLPRENAAGAIAQWEGWWWAYPLMFVEVGLILFVRGIARKLGPRVLLDWLLGRYYSPRVEERIFMFLDMRDSTAIAESLGDLRFSALIRDFFDDLSGPIIETYGEVSHYIGDEAVLTWRPERGLPEARCLQCFFRFQFVLEQRSTHYVKQYGFVPQFKAGVHIGSVVATEVGKLKSEIVFHGDVLNTAARAQTICRELGANLLVTGTLTDRLPSVSWLKLADVGEIALKGKATPVALIRAELATLETVNSLSV